MKALRVLCVLLCSLWMAAAGAATLGVVEQVQPPAWLDRGGFTDALRPGVTLLSGDRIRTGAQSRVYLQLAEGSRVKLGAQADFLMQSDATQPARLFEGALDLVAGAFRFTTDAVQGARGRRDLRIRVATATIGIRGTDVWGKAAADRDLVALIEGTITLERDGEVLSIAPMQYMDAPRGAAAEVKSLSPEVLAALAQETEILPAQGATRQRGLWSVRVAMAENQTAALGLYDELRQAGYAAQIHPVGSKGGGWRYELRLPGLQTHADALTLAGRLGRVLSGRQVPVALRS